MARKQATAKLSRTEQFGALSRGQGFTYDPEDLTLITDESHPLYDPRVKWPPNPKLVKSIMKYGVLVPIIIRRNGTDKKGKAIIEVVDGRQRVKCCLEANKVLKEAGEERQVVPAVCKTADQDKALGVMITTNEVRQGDDDVTKAEKLSRFLDRTNNNEQAAKVAFGLDSRELAKLKAVMGMAAGLKAALHKRTITLEIANTIASLPEEKQEAALAAVFGEAGTGRGDKAKAAAHKQAGTKAKSKPKTRTCKAILLALDTVSCQPKTDYRHGVLDCLEWMLGKRDVAWSGEVSK